MASNEEDIRTLWVDYDEQGCRYKEFKKVVAESKEVRFGDGEIDGPPSLLHLLKHMLRHGGNPRLWLDIWERAKGISVTDRTHHEIAVLIEAIYVAGCMDQINMPALQSFEVLGRRVQSIVDAHSADSQRPQWSNARLFSGVGSAVDAISPELRQYVARRAKDEAEVETMRQRSRALAVTSDALSAGGLPKQPPPAKAGKGDGKGKGKPQAGAAKEGGAGEG